MRGSLLYPRKTMKSGRSLLLAELPILSMRYMPNAASEGKEKTLTQAEQPGKAPKNVHTDRQHLRK